MSNTQAGPRGAALVVALLLVASLIGLLAAPAQAAEQCLADGVDDLLDLVTGRAASNPNGDIESLCVTHSPGSVVLSARLGAHTDIATYPAWTPGSSALVFQVDVDPDGSAGTREYDVAIGRAADVPAYSVIRTADNEVVCGGPLPDEALPTPRFPTISVTLDTAACLPAPDGSAPAVLRAGVYVLFGEDNGNPTIDELPEDGALFGQALDTSARPTTVEFPGVARLAGRTRIETAIATSRFAFPDGTTAGAVVLATGQPPTPGGQPATSSPDALAAGPLATHVNGPVLLLGPPAEDQLSPEVLAEIQRILPTGRTVYVVGGSAVIDPEVESDLRAIGYSPVRLAGVGREATSLAVALEIDPEPTRIVLADGGRFEFALLGAAYAASANIRTTGPDGPAGNAVLLLTTGDGAGNGQLHPVYAGYLRTPRAGREFVTVGQGATAAALRDGLQVPVENRLFAPNDDVFATSLAVAARYVDGPPAPAPIVNEGDPEPLPRIDPPGVPTTAVFTNGLSFPDAIPGAALAGRFSAPLLFSWPDSLPAGARAWLRSNPHRMSPAFVLGGPAALRDAVAEQVSICGTLGPGSSTPECRRE